MKINKILIYNFYMTNKDLILFILKNRWECSITEIIKILYLIDLAFLKEKWTKISNLNYIRYNYWPFDKSIYEELENLLNKHEITYKYYNTSFWDEIVKYTINNIDTKINIDSDKTDFIVNILDKLWGFTASDLTKIAYDTEPMRKINARLWWTEWFMTKLI